MKYLQFEKGVPADDIKDLLQNNIIGTPGKSLVYQHLKTSEKLDYIDNPAFLSLRLGGNVVGTACFIDRKVSVKDHEFNATYIRYFSFRRAFRSSSDPVNRINKSSLLKSELETFFQQSDRLQYAYVDPGNIRSKRIIGGYGFEKVGVFRTVFLSRFDPKPCHCVEVLAAEMRSQMKDLLRAFYKDYGLYFSDNIGYQDSYFIIRENNEIVAGIQANPEHWHVHEIPGSKHLINIVSGFPIIKRIFNKNFRFLSLEGVFYKKGHEEKVVQLIEHALHYHQRYTAVICLDPKCAIYDLFKTFDLGFIKNLTSEKEMAIMAQGKDSQIQALRQIPKYVSGFDNM